MPEIDLVAGFADDPTVQDDHASDRVFSRSRLGFARDGERVSSSRHRYCSMTFSSSFAGTLAVAACR
jgi:hypothetical protein